MKLLMGLIFIVCTSLFGVDGSNFDKEFQQRQADFDKQFKQERADFDKKFAEDQKKFDEDFKNSQTNFNLMFGVVVVFILSVWVFVLIKRNDVKKQLPSVEEYLNTNPQCKNDNGISCNQCGSRSIKNWGYGSANDTLRIHLCNSCGKKLYKSEII